MTSDEFQDTNGALAPDYHEEEKEGLHVQTADQQQQQQKEEKVNDNNKNITNNSIHNDPDCVNDHGHYDYDCDDDDNDDDHHHHHDDDDDYDPGPGCRPCCSNPFGVKSSILIACLGTIVSALSLIPIFSCNYMTPNFEYCYPSDRDRYNGDILCFQFDENNVGLFFHQVIQEGTGLKGKIDIFPGWFQSFESWYYTGLYGVCQSYNMNNVVEGFWYDVRHDYMDTPYIFACVFAGLAMGIGLVALFAGWMICCVAFSKRTRQIISTLCFAGGVMEILTLIFLTAGVCEDQCQLQFGGVVSIVASLLFFITSCAWWKISQNDYDRKVLPIQCCCCPEFQPVVSGGVTEVELQRSFYSDGRVVLQKTTTSSTGFKTITRTTCKPDIRYDLVSSDNVDVVKQVQPIMSLSTSVRSTGEVITNQEQHPLLDPPQSDWATAHHRDSLLMAGL